MIIEVLLASGNCISVKVPCQQSVIFSQFSHGCLLSTCDVIVLHSAVINICQLLHCYLLHTKISLVNRSSFSYTVVSLTSGQVLVRDLVTCITL